MAWFGVAKLFSFDLRVFVDWLSFITKGTLKKIFRAAFIVTLSVVSFLGFLILLSGMQRDQCIDNENRMMVGMVVLAVILFSASIVLVTKRN